MRRTAMMALVLALVVALSGCGIVGWLESQRPGAGNGDDNGGATTVEERREMIEEQAELSVTCEQNCSEVNPHTGFIPAAFSFEVTRLPDLVLGYNWTFEEGATANGPRATYKYGEPGEYEAEVCLMPKGASEEDEAVCLTQFIVVERNPVADRAVDYYVEEREFATFKRWIYVNWAADVPQYIVDVEFELKTDVWMVEWEDHWVSGSRGGGESAGRTFAAGVWNQPDWALREGETISFPAYFVEADRSDIEIVSSGRFCIAINVCDVFEFNQPRVIDTDGLF